MRHINFMVSIAMLINVTNSHARTKSCILSLNLSAQAYTALVTRTPETSSQAAIDEASYDWVECRANQLKNQLKATPKISSQIDQLRLHYRKFIAAEAEIASLLAGGGTMYGHAIPRAYPRIETTLNDIAFLLQNLDSRKYSSTAETSIDIIKRKMQLRLSRLRLKNPYSQSALQNIDIENYNSAIFNYESTYRSLLNLFGNSYTPLTEIEFSLLSDSKLLDDN